MASARGAGPVVLSVSAVAASALRALRRGWRPAGPRWVSWARFPVPRAPPRGTRPPQQQRRPRSGRAVRARSGLCLLHSCWHPAGEASAAARPGAERRRTCVACSGAGCRLVARAQERGVPTRPCRRALRWSLLTESKRLIKRRKAVSRSVVLGGRQRPRPQRSRPEPRPPAEGHCVRCARRGLAQTRAG